jgi:hypothetical protein
VQDWQGVVVRLLMCCAVLQMLLDEFMSVRQNQLGHLWGNKAAAWRAFKDLVDQGLIAFLAAR